MLRAEIYGDDVAAIIVEPIQGEGGFIVPTVEFMQELRAIADEIGACLIIDEIQAGFGRTGKWLCQEHYGVKAGHRHRRQGHRLRLPARRHRRQPRALGQVPARLDGRHLRRQRRRLRRRRRDHGRHEGRGHARERHAPGREAAQVLHRASRRLYPCIGEVRGKGLMDAIECVVPGTKEPNAAVAKAFIAECKKRHLIIMGAGSFGQRRALPAAAQHQRRGHGLRDRHLQRGREGRVRLSGSADQLVREGGALRRPALAAYGRARRPRPGQWPGGRSGAGGACRLRRRARLRLVSTPAPSTPSFQTRVRVRYADTDADGVVYYANYLTYFEVVRVEWLRALGYPITRILAKGIILPVVEARLKYLRPARVDDLLTISADARLRRPGVVRVRLRDHARGRAAARHRLDSARGLRARERRAPAPCRVDARPVCQPAGHGTGD